MSAIMAKTIEKLAKRGEGILAADESTATIQKRFDAINVQNSEENRQAYRDLLFTSPDMNKYINGVIMFDETLKQKGLDGKPFTETLQKLGVIPGIKVDLGLIKLALTDNELITRGIDTLRERLTDYKKHGALFAKWRAVYDISDIKPSKTAMHSAAELLARYAALCQEQDIIPIVEPEVIMDGNHTIERCEEVTREVLNEVFKALAIHNVQLKYIILKPNMVISGSSCATQADRKTVAKKTVALLKECVPAEVPTINFLSGGQSDEDATAHLNLMVKEGNLPWNLSYSYGRALQAACQKAWSGKKENVEAGKQAFLKRAKLNSLAAVGEYEPSME